MFLSSSCLQDKTVFQNKTVSQVLVGPCSSVMQSVTPQKRALSSLIHACKKISFQILSGRSVKTTDTKTRTMARSCLALRKQHSQTTQSPWPAMHVPKACTLLTAVCFCLFCFQWNRAHFYVVNKSCPAATHTLTMPFGCSSSLHSTCTGISLKLVPDLGGATRALDCLP